VKKSIAFAAAFLLFFAGGVYFCHAKLLLRGVSASGGSTATPVSTSVRQVSALARQISAPARQVAYVTLKNISRSSSSNVQQTFAQPFKLGDVPNGNKIEIRKADGITLVTTQEDGCSTWAQDGSRQNCNVSFIAADPIASGASLTYYVYSVPGSPTTTVNVSRADITGKTNFCLKTSDLAQANGTPETGAWDLICLNTVLNKYARYNSSTGYGRNPVGGWEYYAAGPNRVGIHAFQYPIRESDSAVERWIRTDMWIDFWGSGSTPCPCSVRFTTSQPNSFGAIASGTIGPTTEPAYVWSEILYDGATLIHSWGGAYDARTITNLTSASFDSRAGKVTLPSGNGYEKTSGVFPVRVTSTSTCPRGLTCGGIYWIGTSGATDPSNPNSVSFYPMQCAIGGGNAGCNTMPIGLNTTGSGTITLTPYVYTNPFSGFAGADTNGDRVWVSSAGTNSTAPVTLLGHDFTYLTQKTKAVMPYIASLSGRLKAYSVAGSYNHITSSTYYPGSYFLPADLNTTGSGGGDERIGPINHTATIALFMPNDVGAAVTSKVMATQIEHMEMYHFDETVGQPVVLNNGPAKNGVTYATLGLVQPARRSFPFNSGRWLTPSSAQVDTTFFVDRYAVRMDPSHMPRSQQEALIRTGQPEWLFSLQNQTIGILSGTKSSDVTVGSAHYYRVLAAYNNQPRGVGWGQNALSQSDYFTPDSSPLAQYFHDLQTDNANWAYPYHQSLTNAVKLTALGFYDPDVSGLHFFQPWMDDFMYSMEALDAWRGEYPGFIKWLNNWYGKQVVGRMDPAAGGCMWAGPVRYVYPYVNNIVNTANVPHTWSAFFKRDNYNATLKSGAAGSITRSVLTVVGANPAFPAPDGISVGQGVLGTGVPFGLTITSLGSGKGGLGTYNLSASATVTATDMSTHLPSDGFPMPPWAGCPVSGLATEGYGASSLGSDAAMSLAIGAAIGFTNASTLYDAFRVQQLAGGTLDWASYPVFAIGRPGATQ
jgi:hypothetical protein